MAVQKAIYLMKVYTPEFSNLLIIHHNANQFCFHSHQNLTLVLCHRIETECIKVGISGYGNLQTMSIDKWVTSKSTQLSTKTWVKLLLLLENALKLNFEAF